MKKLLLTALFFTLNMNILFAGEEEKDIPVQEIKPGLYRLFDAYCGNTFEKDHETGEESKIFDRIFTETWENTLREELKTTFTVEELKLIRDHINSSEYKKLLSGIPILKRETKKAYDDLMAKSYPPVNRPKISKSYEALLQTHFEKTRHRNVKTVDGIIEEMLPTASDAIRQNAKNRHRKYLEEVMSSLYATYLDEQGFKRYSTFDMSPLADRFSKFTNKAFKLISQEIHKIIMADLKSYQTE